MKKILSIFMVAVLSLNLLYQPCVATNDKKEAVSSVTQESISVGEQSEKPSGNGIKAKTEASQSKAADKSKPEASFFKEVVVDAIYGICLALLVYGIGYFCGYKQDAYNDGFKNGIRDGMMRGMLFFVKEGQKAAIDKYCEVKQTDVAFPIDKMSKKCLKHTLVSLHPDRFQCYEDIKDFYVKAQEAYDKKK